jgi:hypothetical protein
VKGVDRREKRLLAIGFLICAVVGIINIYYALILFVILVTLLVSLRIMQETRSFPDVACRLREDAKGIVVRNRGNAKALAIHIALVPLDLEFDVPSLEPEQEESLVVAHMISETKAVVTFENALGGKYTRTYLLSATGKGEEDLLKPMIPLFGWK